VQVRQSRDARLRVANAVGWHAWEAKVTFNGEEVELKALQEAEQEEVRLESKAYVRHMESEIRGRLLQNCIVRPLKPWLLFPL
jgi:hypothetical protein